MKKNKNLYKIILDILMTSIIVILMKITTTGVFWHELLGVGVFFLFIFHKLINFKTLSCLIKNFKKVPTHSKSMFIIDIFLFINFLVVVITGIMISRELFNSYFTLSNDYFVSAVHHSSAYIGLILISVHIGLHWSCIINIVKNKLKIQNASRMRTAFSRIITVIIMFLGIQSSFDQNVLSVLSQPLSNESITLDSSASYNEDLLLSDNDSIYDDTSQKTTAYNVSASSEITLDEYLSSLFCTLCPKHCALSSPMCSKGEALAQEATANYYSLYGSSSTNSDNTTTENATTDENATNEENDVSDETLSENGKHRLYDTGTEDDSINIDDNETSDDNISTDTNSLPIENALDYVSIMGLYIGGTHYLVKIPRKKQHKTG